VLRAGLNAAGTHPAWGSNDGSVTRCDIAHVYWRLGEIRLGW